MMIEEKNPAIDAARKIATSVTKYQEALGYEPDCSDLASEAYSNYAKFAKIEDIGTAYLLSTCNQYFAYDLKLLDDRLFLRETQSAEPKILVYSLQTRVTGALLCPIQRTHKPSSKDKMTNCYAYRKAEGVS